MYKLPIALTLYLNYIVKGCLYWLAMLIKSKTIYKQICLLMHSITIRIVAFQIIQFLTRSLGYPNRVDLDMQNIKIKTKKYLQT